MEFLKKISTQIGDFIIGLSTQKKIAMVATIIAIVGAVTGLFLWAGDKTYTPLMTNLNAEDSANIIRVLREKNIPFRVDSTGANISVLPQYVDQLRMDLAIGGLPQSSVVGYEVFDKTNLGTTSFVQKVNQKRAMEGELMRTINAIQGVKRSRVHLAIPQKSTFVEDQKKATASVVLDLDPGVRLNEKQVFGIGNLVARSIEGMDPADVVIVDSQGKTLSKNASDSLSQMTAGQLDYRGKIETDMERRIEEMLARVVGEGHVVARVTADLDFSSVSETQTSYDQDGSAVRSTQKNNQSMEGNKPVASGQPGAASNLPLGQAQANSVKISDTKTNNEVVNYAVPETIKRTTRSPGGLKRLSVAVVVDGKTVKAKNADGVVESKVEAWAPEKLKEFESIVSSAVGIDKKRGDTLEIKNMEFQQTDFQDAENLLAEREKKSYIQSLILYAVIGLTIVLFFFLVIRPFIRWITDNTTDGVDSFLPQTLEELERMQKGAGLPGLEDAIPSMPEQVDPEKIESQMVREKVITLVDANPTKAALILKDWLAAPASVKAPGADGEGGDKGQSA